MPDIEYTGMADHKEFSSEDFKRHGVEDQNKVVFKEDARVQSVSDAAWEFLSGDASGEKEVFKLAESSEPTEGDGSTGDVESAADAAKEDDPSGSTEPISGPSGSDDGTAKAKAGRTGRGSSAAGTTT